MTSADQKWVIFGVALGMAVLWTALAGSSHFASFDRSKCSVFSGPEMADGRQCDEGWSFYKAPGPNYRNTEIGSDFHYYNWVDQFNTLGLGENVPIANGSSSDSLLALMPDTGEWVVLRVPYPQGFHSRGLDGRIDDPKNAVLVAAVLQGVHGDRVTFQNSMAGFSATVSGDENNYPIFRTGESVVGCGISGCAWNFCDLVQDRCG